VISSARRSSRRPQRDLGDRDSTTRVGSGPRATEANFCSTPTTCVSAAAWQNARNVKLRNAHLAIVDSSRVLDYLLNEAHPDNGGKARFFGSLGYFAGGSRPPDAGPSRGCRTREVVRSAESAHGQKHVVDGRLSGHTQESRQWSIRTVWIIDRGEDAPRLVTAYPGKE
jgi:hypothetical protein